MQIEVEMMSTFEPHRRANRSAAEATTIVWYSNASVMLSSLSQRQGSGPFASKARLAAMSGPRFV